MPWASWRPSLLSDWWSHAATMPGLGNSLINRVNYSSTRKNQSALDNELDYICVATSAVCVKILIVKVNHHKWNIGDFCDKMIEASLKSGDMCMAKCEPYKPCKVGWNSEVKSQTATQELLILALYLGWLWCISLSHGSTHGKIPLSNTWYKTVDLNSRGRFHWLCNA